MVLASGLFRGATYAVGVWDCVNAFYFLGCWPGARVGTWCALFFLAAPTCCVLLGHHELCHHEHGDCGIPFAASKPRCPCLCVCVFVGVSCVLICVCFACSCMWWFACFCFGSHSDSCQVRGTFLRVVFGALPALRSGAGGGRGFHQSVQCILGPLLRRGILNRTCCTHKILYS